VGGGARGSVVTLRALLAADCGSGVGLGHLERMLALADALRPDLDVVMIVPEGDVALRQRVVDRGHTPLEAPGTSAQRVGATAGAATSVDVVVLDGYVFDVAVQRRIRERAPLTVVDDLQLPTECDLAVNPSPGGDGMRPPGAAAFLGGAAYALLRSSFLDARDAVTRHGRPERSVLVSTGATDLDGLAKRVTAELLRRDATVEVIRVVGPDTGVVTKHNHPRERLLVAPAGLADALAGASVYVGAAGTTAVQAACVGIPAVITAAVPNQTAQAAALAASGCALVTDAHDLAATCLELLDDPARCEQMASRGRSLVDGRGPMRVATAVRNLTAARAAS
jgi:spore coat polysaccharide biosynthesis predicted glycosyltransferase SpsG